MKLQDITRILHTAGLAPIAREQLMRLAGTPEGKRFEAALCAVDAGDAGQRIELVRIVDRLTAATASTPPATTSCARPPFSACSPGAPAAAGQAKAPPPYENFHIYSSTAALCISEAKVRSSNSHTIQVEAAGMLTGGARRSVDWPNKIIIQLNEQELMLALALFTGKIRAVSFSSHGNENDKFMRVERQQYVWFAEVGQQGKPLRGVPIRAGDATKIVSLAYRQVLANSPHLDSGMIGTMIDLAASMHKDPVPTQLHGRRS